MKSYVVHFRPGSETLDLPDNLKAVDDLQRKPDLILAFIPPTGHPHEYLQALTAHWPETPIAGSEAVIQFANHRLIASGCVHLFWWSSPVIPDIIGLSIEPNAAESLLQEVARKVTSQLKPGATYLLLSDGLEFPIDRFLPYLRRHCMNHMIRILGGLASQPLDVEQPRSRVFHTGGVLRYGCLFVELPRLEIRYTILRGWDPASPVYTVTRADHRILYEIAHEPVKHWFERFFTLEGGMAPMPETAYQFPIIIVGPEPERRLIYRSLRAYDHPPGAVTLWGDIKTGEKIRLGIGNGVTLVRKALPLFQSFHPDTVLLFSCVGREVVLGGLAETELKEFYQYLKGVPISGCFTYGEVGPNNDEGPIFFNQTAVVIGLREA